MPLRIIFFNPWADGLEEAAAFLERLPRFDVASRLAAGADDRLRRMARLDCDWHGECARCFADMMPAGLAPRTAWITGAAGLPEVAKRCAQTADETRWFIFMGQHPEKLGPALAPFCAFLRKHGVRFAYYAFDEASRTMPCFAALAPHLDVFIHDEAPLGPAAAGLRADCLRLHRSWVANLAPFATPLTEAPEPNLVFLGSELGLTPHRQRQIDFLRTTFKDRFTAICDHSLPVSERTSLARRFTASVCPEGRKFTTAAMARTHTDRPFWSGCLGLVPVSENSAQGGRLDDLADAGLVLRYAHADLADLRTTCERAMSMTVSERRRIHDHFNRRETIGAVMAETLRSAMTGAR